MHGFADRCVLYACLQAFHKDYIDTMDDLCFEATIGIGESLCYYHMECVLHGKQVMVPPTVVYTKYKYLIYLLPEDCQNWGFIFYDLFMNTNKQDITIYDWHMQNTSPHDFAISR
jgi:hypothetical protein